MRASNFVGSFLIAFLLAACQVDSGPIDELDEIGSGGGSQSGSPIGHFIEAPRLLSGTDGLLLNGNDLWVAMSLVDAVIIIDIRTGWVKRIVASEADADATELVVPDDFWRDPITGDIYMTEVGSGTGGHVTRIAPDGTRTRILTNYSDNVAFPNGITGLHRPGEPVHVYIAPTSFFGRKTGIFEVDVTGATPPTLVYGAQNGVDVYGEGLPGGGNGMVFDDAGNELFVPTTFGGKVLAVDVVNHTARTVWNGSGGTAKAVYVRFTNDRTGLIYTEHSSGRLLRLDPYGAADQVPTLVAQLEKGLDAVAIAPDGRMFTSNFIHGGIAVVKPDGSRRNLYPRSMNIPNGIAELDDGRLAVGDTGSLAIVDPDAPFGELPERPKFFIDGDATIGVANGGGCNLYVTTFYRRNIQHYDVCAALPNVASNITAPLTMGIPNDMVLVGSTLYVTDAAGVIWRMTVNGAAPTTAAPIAGGLAIPYGIAAHDGNIYASEWAGNQVRVINGTTGAPVRTITGLEAPEGLAVEADGSVLVIESKKGVLTRVRPDGTRQTVVKFLGTSIKGILHPLTNYFADVMLTNDGESVVITEPLSGSIREFDL